MVDRVGIYVDGFNVYYGMLRKNWRRYLWLDYRSLFESMLKEDQTLAAVNYFTAMSKDPGSRKRQQTYLSALALRGGLTVHLGRLAQRPHTCQKCGKRSHRWQEKESDVRIALEMYRDAVNDRVDTVWLMSRDADLVPAVEAVLRDTDVKVVIFRPPNGSGDRAGGDALVSAAGGNQFHVERRLWARNQLPDVMQRAKGSTRIRRPVTWSEPDGSASDSN